MPPGRSVAERARSDEEIGAGGQDSFDTREVTDDVLLQALERRERAKDRRRDAQASYKEAHDVVKGRIDALDLGDDEEVRVGRFRCRFRRVSGGSVSFETSASRRLFVTPE